MNNQPTAEHNTTMKGIRSKMLSAEGFLNVFRNAMAWDNEVQALIELGACILKMQEAHQELKNLIDEEAAHGHR